MVTAMILGMAVGGWLAGVLIDKLGVHRASMFPAMATLAALVIATVYAQSFMAPLKPPAVAGKEK